MFEVDGRYANRKGEYTVLELNPPKMRVRYKDGSEAELKIELQERIWQNIAADYEALTRANTKKMQRRKAVAGANHFIKVVTLSADDLSVLGWAERMIMGPDEESNIEIKTGDRIIIYIPDKRSFLAVATITGDPKMVDPKDYFFTVKADSAAFYPVDVDAEIAAFENGLDVDLMELESQPKFKRMRIQPESYLTISEDDFELLSEAIIEISEEEDESADLVDEDDFEDEEE